MSAKGGELAELAAAISVAQARSRSSRKVSVEEQLRVVALELFLERGFDEVTVGDIAARADVTPRTFFRYFPSKETVVVDIADHNLNRLIELVEQAPRTSTVLDLLRHALSAWYADIGHAIPLLHELALGSESVNRVVAARREEWVRRLSDTIPSARPEVSAAGARIWALVAFDIVRLTNEHAEATGIAHAQAVSIVCSEFATELGIPAAVYPG